MLEKIANKRVAMISGWAVDPNARYRYQVDAAFPLSDHADYTDLIRYVDLVQPKRVLTLHGFAAEFARDLRERGVEAWALSQENQLELTLGKTAAADAPASVVRQAPREAAAEPAASELAVFAEIGESIAATPGKLQKVRILADYFRSLDAEQLPIATRYLTGKAFAQSDPRTLQVGWAVIFRAVPRGDTTERLRVAPDREQPWRRLGRPHSKRSDGGRLPSHSASSPRSSCSTRCKEPVDQSAKRTAPGAARQTLRA
jgi:DNA ligase-1